MNRIRALRKQMDMTQKELAKHLQIADSTLSYWEMGKYEPDIDALMKLSRFFEVPIDHILGGDFTRWNINGEDVSYQGIKTAHLTDCDMTVSEANISYNRIEFAGLTHDEIELLAEFAEFIKSRRKVD